MKIEEFIKETKTYNPLAKGSTKRAEKMIRENETVLLAINTNVETIYDNKENGENQFKLFGGATQLKNVQNGVVVITNDRIFFVSSVLGSGYSKEMPISDIRSIDDTKSFTGLGELRIHGMTETFCIKIQRKELFDKIRNAIKEAQNSLSNNLSVKESNLSPTDEIRKYKSLLDDGIITQEEFEAKKKELLNI